LFRQIIKVKNFYIWRTFYSIHVHYVEVFFTARTENRVHCSELGGVHYIEVCLQQKSIGGTETCVQIGGVHYIEVFTNGGFTVIISLCFILFRIFVFVQSKTSPFTCSTSDLNNKNCNLPTSCLYPDQTNCDYYYKCSPATSTAHKQCATGNVYYANNKACDLYSLYAKYCPPGST
jgi:hypothetical protein